MDVTAIFTESEVFNVVAALRTPLTTEHLFRGYFCATNRSINAYALKLVYTKIKARNRDEIAPKTMISISSWLDRTETSTKASSLCCGCA
jgi:hypothetical protein